ncbi:MAG TPA: TetR/AcrR family transcriptional regulator [Bradyrhizobium sp.]|nr:TetR/AcrR family transcriptional regulator [Bradyrhizobium sp.]
MVVAASEDLQAVQEQDNSKRRQILDGARKVFMDLGFDGASMGEIARAAQVSKGTLYVYFADKSALFEAIIEEEALQHGQVVFSFDPARDAESTLKEFGLAYLHLICRPGGGSAIRTVMAIAERMPDVGRRYYARVLDKSISRLSDYLKARVVARDLDIDDCDLAASQFMELSKASLFLPFVFQAAPVPSERRMAEVVQSATRMFLAAYKMK